MISFLHINIILAWWKFPAPLFYFLGGKSGMHSQICLLREMTAKRFGGHCSWVIRLIYKVIWVILLYNPFYDVRASEKFIGSPTITGKQLMKPLSDYFPVGLLFPFEPETAITNLNLCSFEYDWVLVR
jgi:hypothetical protein